MKPEMREIDYRIWERELEDFVPDSVFDAHTHIWSDEHKSGNAEDASALRLPVSLQDLHAWTLQQFPGRRLGYLLLATPLRNIDFQGHNQWVADQAKQPGDIPLPAVSAMLIVPGMTREYVKSHAESNGVQVLKPYRVFADDPKEGDITDFLPEEVLEAADELGMAVTLHLSKSRGPADEKNLADLELLCKKFPNVKWILAHCARAFNSAHLEHSISRLSALESVFMDTSAVSDPYAHYITVKHFDREKILFGTDNIAAGSARGKYVTFGYGWDGYWEKDDIEHCDPRCTFVCYEQLRSQRQAYEMAGLTKREIEDIFYRNSLKFFG